MLVAFRVPAERNGRSQVRGTLNLLAGPMGQRRTCCPHGRLLMYIHCHSAPENPRKTLLMSRYRPSYDEFVRRIGKASCVPVYRQLTGDGLTPVSAFRKVARSAPSFLFESVIGGEKVGRYSFLGTEPFLKFEARGPEVVITPTGQTDGGRRFTSQDPFRDLQELVECYRAAPTAGLPRFTGGAVGYASYDSVRYTENLPQPPPDDRGLADLSFAFYDAMVLFDHIRKTILVVAQAHVGEGADPRAAYQAACRRIDERSPSSWPSRRSSWASATSTPSRPSR